MFKSFQSIGWILMEQEDSVYFTFYVIMPSRDWKQNRNAIL